MVRPAPAGSRPDPVALAPAVREAPAAQVALAVPVVVPVVVPVAPVPVVAPAEVVGRLVAASVVVVVTAKN